ncbi:MAG: tetratricopeptide repeat protein [Gammaproteobacteria bacterium]|nr:tetratricopeptide repeat protein [Gammaproteobacteria bacterium]
MAFVHIKNLLHKSIGLHADTVGDSSIDRAISQRMHATACSNASTYYKLVKSDKRELDELIEEVVVPETWFFRNITPFEVLRDNALKIYANAVKPGNSIKYDEEKNKNHQLKILSVPCSSGEEPYSIAMVLSDLGFKKEDFLIDAVDVSQRALKKSRRAIYGRHSFREKGMSLQNKYFAPVKSEFQLVSDIRDCVSFRKGNIITDPISPSEEYYDIIFCRNLLIYFNRETQQKMLEKLSIMLKCGGLLFVGHAESGQIDKNYFTKIRVAKAFSFRKKMINKLSGYPVKLNEQPVNKLKDIYDQLVEVTKKDIELSKKIKLPQYKTTGKYNNEGVDDNKSANNRFFQKIDLLINTGDLSDAFQACEEFLKKQPEDSSAYYYLGLISNLQGNNADAETLLRKAIYLSPDHYKALALSAVLAEQRGDEDSAKSLRRREQKARKRSP